MNSTSVAGRRGSSSSVLCLLCGRGPAESSEHIVPKALGGKKVVQGFICQTCNNRLGKEIDAPTEETWRPFSVLMRCRKGDGTFVAPCRNVLTQSGRRIDLYPDSAPVFRPATPVQGDRRNGVISILVQHENLDKAAQLIAHQIRRFAGDPDDYKCESATETTVNPGRALFYWHMDVRRSARSVAKSGLAALRDQQGHEILRSGQFDPVIAFVAGNSGSYHRYWTRVPNQEAQVLPPLDLNVHRLVVSTYRGGVSCCVLFFGSVAIVVQLSQGWRGAPFSIEHSVDPRSYTHAIRRSQDTHPVFGEAALLQVDGEPDLEKAIGRLRRHAESIQEQDWKEAIIAEAHSNAPPHSQDEEQYGARIKAIEASIVDSLSLRLGRARSTTVAERDVRNSVEEHLQLLGQGESANRHGKKRGAE